MFSKTQKNGRSFQSVLNSDNYASNRLLLTDSVHFPSHKAYRCNGTKSVLVNVSIQKVLEIKLIVLSVPFAGQDKKRRHYVRDYVRIGHVKATKTDSHFERSNRREMITTWLLGSLQLNITMENRLIDRNSRRRWPLSQRPEKADKGRHFSITNHFIYPWKNTNLGFVFLIRHL
jgi:hypothetical protein